MPALSLESLLTLVAAISTLGLLKLFLEYHSTLTGIKYVSNHLSEAKKRPLTLDLSHHPGFRMLFHHLDAISNVIPVKIPTICLGNNFPFIRKYERVYTARMERPAENLIRILLL